MKRDCIIFDLDGTICNTTHRKQYVASKPKNWDAWNAGLVNDVPNEAVHLIYEALYCTYKDHIDIFLVSGRSEDYRIQTEEWLSKYGFYFNGLYMRKTNDHRKDHIVKSEIVDEIEKTHKIIAVFDDRRSVLSMWESRGVFTFDVGQGKGNF